MILVIASGQKSFVPLQKLRYHIGTVKVKFQMILNPTWAVIIVVQKCII